MTTMFKFKKSTSKKPAVAASRAMVVESLEGRAMFSVTYGSDILTGAGPGGGPHLPVQTAPISVSKYSLPYVELAAKAEPPPSP
jgi:hypothetical protein